jgi:hypothetical protein
MGAHPKLGGERMNWPVAAAGRVSAAAAAFAFSMSIGTAQEDSVEVTAARMSPAIVLPGADPQALPEAPTPPPLRSARLPSRPDILPFARPYASEPGIRGPVRSLRPVARDPWAAPDLRWDGHPQAMRWTLAAMAALRGPGAPLIDTDPRDIAEWCPGYEAADAGQRRAFWAGLVSVLAWHESTHRPTAVGGGGRWFGLVQIAPGTARWRGCSATTAQALLDGPANLRCGVRIMGITVPRDRVVSRGMQGVAADWGPFHSTRKREDMRSWVRAQDYCRPPPPSAMRPVLRPASASATGRLRPLARPAASSG